MSHVPQLDGSIRRAFSALCWNVGTPVAYKAQLAMKREDWVALTTIKVVVASYTCLRTLSGDLQIAAFFKKFPDFDLGINLEARAVESFWESERQCYKSNERLAALCSDRKIEGEGVYRFITDVRKEVSRVLGRCPSPEELEPRFGPGSTYSDIGPHITVPDKMSNDYTMTSKTRRFLAAWDKTAWSRFAAAGLERFVEADLIGNNEIVHGLTQNHLDSTFSPRLEKIVRGNRFTTVEKTAWQRRGICMGPSITLFYQLGVGTWITKRLGRTVGWFKSSRQTFHRFLARLASLTGLSATVDLKSASDTMCRNFVKLCTPDDWFKLLDDLRETHTWILDPPVKGRPRTGKWVRLEKFSSMGNGFTFELETLLFYAVVKVASVGTKNSGDWYGDVVSVFGDDIICPRDRALDVIAALKFFGFTTNEDKTFINGKFRESCGGDFYQGKDVRPHYLKENPCEPHQFIALANGLRRFGIRHILCGGPDVYRIPWLRILDSIPSQIRGLRGPEALGDLVIHDDDSNWRVTVRSSVRYFRVWRPVMFGKTSWSHFRPGVVLASALYGCSDGSNHKPMPPRGGPEMDTSGISTRVSGEYVSGYRFGRVAYS